MTKKKKISRNPQTPGATGVENPIEVFASLLGALEEGDREEEIALYMEELEKSGAEKDPVRLARDAREKAREVLRRRGLEGEFGWDTQAADAFAAQPEQDPEEDLPEDTRPARGGQKGTPGNLSTRQLAVIGASVVVLVLLIVGMVMVLRPLFAAPEEGEATSPASDSAQAQTPSEPQEGALTLPEGIETATGMTLELSRGVYTVTAGDSFAIEPQQGQPQVVQNLVDGETWMLSLEQGGAAITVPSWLDGVTLTLNGAQVSLDGLQTDTLDLKGEAGALTLTGITARQLNLDVSQITVEAQAASIQEGVSLTVKKGAAHLVMPVPQDYGYNVSCTNGMVRVGSTPYLTENTVENEGAAFQYTVSCENATVDIDLAQDEAAAGDTAAAPEGGDDAEG